MPAVTPSIAKKTAARQRQQKTGQSYQSALRAEGGPDRTAALEKTINMAFSVLNNGLYFKKHLAPTREQLMGRIQHALHVLVMGADVPFDPQNPAPGGLTRKTPLEGFDITPPPPPRWGLFDPKAVEDPHDRQKGETVRMGVEPRALWDYWKDLPEARKCATPKALLLGVTDDHPEKPLVTWTSLPKNGGTPCPRPKPTVASTGSATGAL